MLNTPVDRIRCSLVGELRVPARVSSLSVLPSPLSGRVGVHITTFEACSSFTRVTACRVAHPPYVGFIARLRPGRFPGSDARKLPSSTNNLLEWVLPPLVICALEAHTITPSFVHKPRYCDQPEHPERRPISAKRQCQQTGSGGEASISPKVIPTKRDPMLAAPCLLNWLWAARRAR